MKFKIKNVNLSEDEINANVTVVCEENGEVLRFDVPNYTDKQTLKAAVKAILKKRDDKDAKENALRSQLQNDIIDLAV